MSMFTKKLLLPFFIVSLGTLFSNSVLLAQIDSSKSENIDDETDELNLEEENNAPEPQPKRINKIIVSGNKITPTEGILYVIPYKEGEIFDRLKTGELIRTLYFKIKRFKNIWVKAELVGTDFINLHIIVEEKIPLKNIVFSGNSEVTEKEIKEKIDLNIPAVDEQELKPITEKIKNIYREKGYFNAQITTKLDIDTDNRAIATFIVNEREKPLVKQILFKGNKSITSKELKKTIITKEDWILGFLDQSGIYQPERIDADKHFIEQMYQNRGFLTTHVVDVDSHIDPKTCNTCITYEIEEGERYVIESIEAEGNDDVPEQYLLASLPIRVGQYYSRERLVKAIETLEMVWGNFGFIFAHIEPSVQPDEETKTVKIAFFSDLGTKVKLNRLNIRGNRKTRDRIIRRRIGLEEGEVITKADMELSKHSVQSLGFFEARDGVNWKVNRLDEEWADLDLHIKEDKTGHFNFALGYGGAGGFDLNSPNTGLSAKVELGETNLFGEGIRLNMNGTWSKNEQTFVFHLAQPWLFDKPVSGAMDMYHRRPSYSNLGNLQNGAVNQKLTGGALTAGYITQMRSSFLSDTNILFVLGGDSIRYQQPPIAKLDRPIAFATPDYQCILDRSFSPADYVFLSSTVAQDRRNHPMHPSAGHTWTWTNKLAPHSFHGDISYFKTTIDAHWYNAIIGDRDLVLHLHGFAGLVTQIKDSNIPYNELFNIGGDTTVRGYVFGQISPKFAGDPVGGKKALFVNAELIFPIMPDMTIKGVFFYDGGSGWGNPYTCCVEPNAMPLLSDNNFDYRHSVGVGLRILQPMPFRIDWGFKIDPRKGESAYEVHFGMNYDW
jgi:outer membrane protein insertion porin family